MILYLLLVGVFAGIAAQLMYFAAIYEDYQQSRRDRIKLKQFYRDLIIDTVWIQVLFIGIILVMWFAGKLLVR